MREFHRIVKVLRPAGFVIENVLGLKDMRCQGGVIELFDDLGYDVAFHVLRAADHGIPQLRRRVVFVGHRDRGFFRRPQASLRASEHVTVWDAIGDLPAVGPGETARGYDEPPSTDYQRVMRAGSTSLQGHTASNHPPHLVRAISFIPDGCNRRAIPAEHQPSSGFHNSYSRLSSRHPAVAVTSNIIETGKVGAGSRRVGRAGDVDGWNGPELALSIEVKDEDLTDPDGDTLDGFLANLSEWPDATAIVLARRATDEVADALGKQNVSVLTRESMLDAAVRWDLTSSAWQRVSFATTSRASNGTAA